MRPMAVVQLGLEMSFLPFTVAWLISGTTRGTLGSMRKAEELSITTGPFPSERACAYSLEKSPPTARKITSRSRALPSSNSSMVTLPNGVATDLPVERAEAYRCNSETGNCRLPSTLTISSPTAPVAPTMPTFSLAPPAIMLGVTAVPARLRPTAVVLVAEGRDAEGRVARPGRRGV